MKFSHLVFIGRFQPFHNGHLAVVRRALELAERCIILVGSSNIARNPVNPFTFEERKEMIILGVQSELGTDAALKIDVRPVYDIPYNDTQWVTHVTKVAHTAARVWTDGPINVGLIGHSKDHTSFYLKLFPEWGSVNVPAYAQGLSATDIRKYLFSSEWDARAIIANHDLIPNGTSSFLNNFIDRPEHKWIMDERKFYESYAKLWKDAPFHKDKPQIMCADNVVLQGGNVLLVTRKNSPGKGLLALPGGHLEGQTFIDAAVTELKQETRFSDAHGEMPPAKLKSFITASRMFDSPNRSLRGHVVTMAFRYDMPPAKTLYKVKGADDAAHAAWYDISKLDPRDFFEDHCHIIDEMAGTQIALQVNE